MRRAQQLADADLDTEERVPHQIESARDGEHHDPGERQRIAVRKRAARCVPEPQHVAQGDASEDEPV